MQAERMDELDEKGYLGLYRRTDYNHWKACGEEGMEGFEDKQDN